MRLYLNIVIFVFFILQRGERYERRYNQKEYQYMLL